MKCRDCAEARMFAEGGVYCVIYGMIISEEHECTRKGGRLRENRGDGDQEETKLHDDGGSAS